MRFPDIMDIRGHMRPKHARDIMWRVVMLLAVCVGVRADFHAPVRDIYHMYFKL